MRVLKKYLIILKIYLDYFEVKKIMNLLMMDNSEINFLTIAFKAQLNINYYLAVMV